MKRLLIANRGEIARRVMRTAYQMGVQTVAVYSDADANALHVADADSGVALGGNASADSYLRIDKLLAAAKASGADAVHPGYGFLSESAEFAQAVIDAGLIWVGPPPSAVQALGSKSACKALARRQGVPVLGGYEGADQSDERFVAEAAGMGFPVMVKAAAGGGGRGMRLVHSGDQLVASLASARSEALAGFGNAELLMERALLAPRHVEVQVFADQHGNCIHLGERDCSVQRRNQKIIEESPSPAVSPELRQRMGACAVALALGAGYVGAGTVEFLLEGGEFYLMEMNTRLQVEHPVTEAVTGLDLVEWQLRIARGEALPLTQAQVKLTGHAIEVRLCAEDEQFNPHAGRVTALIWPSDAIEFARADMHAGVRIDHALERGLVVPEFYDSMLGKLIAHAPTRSEAIERLSHALARTVVAGLPTNRAMLLACLGHAEFVQGNALVPFLGTHAQGLRDTIHARETALLGFAVSAWVMSRAGNTRPSASLACPFIRSLRLVHRGQRMDVAVLELGNGRLQLEVADLEVMAQVRWRSDHELDVSIDGLNRRVAVAPEGFLQLDGVSFEFSDATFAPPVKAMDANTERQIAAPMNGKVVSVNVVIGQAVHAGDVLVIIEAMKLQHNITAPRNGTVERVHATLGAQVAPRALLVELTTATETQTAA